MGKKDKKKGANKTSDKIKNVSQSVQIKVKKADILFSQIVKKRGELQLNSNGFCRCYTCDVIKLASEMDCGHFEKRGDYSTRWTEENSRPQCRKCNRDLYGNLEEFAKRLELEMPGIVEELKKLANTPIRLTSGFMDEVIEALQKRLKELEGK
jgi:hypothetical protein